MPIDGFPSFQRQSPIQRRPTRGHAATTMTAYDRLPLKGSLPHVLVVIAHLFFLGACFVSFVFPSASDIQVPEMGKPDWFDKSKERSEQQFAKVTMASFGALLVSSPRCFLFLYDWPKTHRQCFTFRAYWRCLGI
jgi:hypothetical protein